MTNRYIEKTTSNLLNILQTVKRSAYQKRGHSDVTFSFVNVNSFFNELIFFFNF